MAVPGKIDEVPFTFLPRRHAIVGGVLASALTAVTHPNLMSGLPVALSASVFTQPSSERG